MIRAPFDLRYDHEMRTVPRHAMSLSQPLLEGKSLVMRLRCLKALMDSERSHLAAWVATPPGIVLS